MRTESIEAIAFLGPPGTFSEVAARSLASTLAEFRPANGISAVFALVAGGGVSAGVVPILSSRIGPIAETIAQFIHSDDVFAVRSTRLRIALSLYGIRGDQSQLQGVASHSAALSQCSEYLALHDLETKAVTSTAEALRLLASGELPADWGAIAAPDKDREYGVRLLAPGIQDAQDAWTHFVRIERGAASEMVVPGRSLLVIAQGPINKVQDWVGALQRNVTPAYCSVADDDGLLVELPAATSEEILRITRLRSRPVGIRLRVLGSLDEELLA